MMSRVIASLSFFQFISSGVLPTREVKYFLKGCNKKIIDAFGELASSVASSLLPEDKTYLKKFRSPLLIIANKHNPAHRRRTSLIGNPRLAIKLSSLAVRSFKK